MGGPMKTKDKTTLKLLAMCAMILSCLAFSLIAVSVRAEQAAPREKVALPQLVQSCTYDGTAKKPQTGSRYCVPNEDASFTVAGTYYVKVRLVDTSRYCWEDGTDGEQTIAFTIEKAVFDQSSLVFSDQTFVYDGKDHYITVEGLPSFATVLFKTLKRDPGVYNSIVQIDLGDNYENRFIELTGAKLVILATSVRDGDFTFINETGFSSEVKFHANAGEAKSFERKLPSVGTVYVACAPKATLGGENYDFGTGKFKYKLPVPTRYTGVKAYVNDGGKAKEVKIDWEGQSAVFETNSMSEFAIVYTGIVAEPPRFLWLEILLGAVIVVEAGFIVSFVLKLKKLSGGSKAE